MTKVGRVLIFGVVMVSLVMPLSLSAQIEVLEFENLEGGASQLPKESISSEDAEPKSSNPDDLIHFGDLIDVDILGSVEFDWRGRVTPEGFLSGLPFTGEQISAICEREGSVAKKIATAYEKFLNNPTIIVTILDRSNRAVSTLFGAISRPHRFRIRREVHLNELIILAGGITEKASGEIQVLRQTGSSCATRLEFEGRNKSLQDKNGETGAGKFMNVSSAVGTASLNIKISDLLSGKKEANPRINYGDLITILEAEPVYVIGAVERPTKIALRSEITVSRAIASSGGVTKGTKATEVTIFRRGLGGTIIIKTNLAEIESGSTKDLLLKPFDIVEVSGRQRTQSRYPPVIQIEEAENRSNELPLRIID